MIVFNFETDFELKHKNKITNWITKIVIEHKFQVGEINYIFCDDDYLHKLNVEFLNHDTLTDIISFDNTVGKTISGDIFISIDRVKENAIVFNESFTNELHRVMIHGVLHYLGYKDKSSQESNNMRLAENEALLKLNY